MAKLPIVFLGLIMFVCSGCGDDDLPPVVNPEEEITKVILTYTNTSDAGDVVTAEWFDEDGDGGQDPLIEPIVLDVDKTYRLTLQFINTFETPPEQITDEILEEAEEHQIFFGFTSDIFDNPAGTGNIPSPTGAVNYEDSDDSGLPVGITTTWVTGLTASGDLRIVLKHQPGIKSATSTVSDGETDVDITFDLIIQ